LPLLPHPFEECKILVCLKLARIVTVILASGKSSAEIKGNAEVLAAIDQSQPRNEIRKQAYRAFVLSWKGHQGKGQRVRIPPCVLAGIRNVWPDPNGSYMGHFDSSMTNDENDAEA
jgi:hypothetical protein